ncbi:hypothetical protein DYB30_006993 [Aphanomyces astaci]|uniref:Glutathione S-transferase n=1 Tax=Aphanomyces astaci TaxID=112090 RepID=A0A397DY29_APHAT|nr:hypothetical protein DYB38_002277 [Aphanomyces astaci]RHY70373.1 hypothetical protein DYB30_006993 [Aphanomyces astaci]RHZ15752.1 hypothetical protein DYB31_012016 [Aphanomyces astaci]
MYTLYYAPATVSMVVHHVLVELEAHGVTHELRLVDIEAGAHKGQDYLRLNPNGLVPTLVVDGLHPVYEAAAITMFLADRHPEAKLAPPANDTLARSTYLQWMFHLANTLQPAFRLWFYPKDLPHVDHEAVKRSIQAQIEAVWDRVDSHLAATSSPYMLGDDVSALDLYLMMLIRGSRNMPKPATAWPRLEVLANRIKIRPSWKVMNDAEGLTDWV